MDSPSVDLTEFLQEVAAQVRVATRHGEVRVAIQVLEIAEKEIHDCLERLRAIELKPDLRGRGTD
jgi:hypothetical protein